MLKATASTLSQTLQRAMTSSAASGTTPASSLVMQLIVDESLLKQPGWTMGPMMAQAAHATSAVITKTFTQPNTQAYVSTENVANMRKVVLKTGAGTSLHELSAQLDAARAIARTAEQHADPSVQEGQGDAFPSHHLWIEQPENVATVLAVAPNTRPSALKKALNKCSLLRD